MTWKAPSALKLYHLMRGLVGSALEALILLDRALFDDWIVRASVSSSTALSRREISNNRLRGDEEIRFGLIVCTSLSRL